MAAVARQPEIDGWIEDYLSYLIGEWEAVPAMAAEWDQWSANDRLDFSLEWPIREDRLRQLEHWADESLLSPSQCDRFRHLLDLIGRYGPTLQKLLKV